jgi:hypothetical protein
MSYSPVSFLSIDRLTCQNYSPCVILSASIFPAHSPLTDVIKGKTMKSKGIVPLVVGLLLLAGWVLAQASMTIQPLRADTGEQQKSKTEPATVPTPWPGAKLEDPIAQLKALLEPVGVRVTESKLINVYDVRKYRSLLIDWKSYKDAPDVVEYDSKKFAHIKELKLINSSTHDGSLQTLHIAAISNDEIFVIGVNADSELL